MKKTSLLLFSLMLIFSACKKDDSIDSNSDDPKTSTCRLAQMDAYVYGDSLNLSCTYDAQNRLIDSKEDYEGLYSGTRYQYNSAGQISKVQKYDGHDLAVYEELIFTYSNGQVMEMRSFDIDDGKTDYSYHYELIYSNNQISEAQFYELVNGQETQTETVEFGYDAVGNIISKTTYDVSQGGKDPVFREVFEYDDMKTVPTFSLFITEDHLFQAKHNITLMRFDQYNVAAKIWDPIETTNYDYQYNSQGYPSDVVIDIGQNARFYYFCP